MFDGIKEKLLGSMAQKYVGVALRALLLSTGVMTAADADTANVAQAAGALVALASFVWGLYEKNQARKEKLTGFQLAGVTETQVKAMVANPLVATPVVSTPADVVPVAAPDNG